MGFMLKDSTALELIAQINKRFEAGEAIDEMVALQAEFGIFSPGHSLLDSFTLLNIRPSDHAERGRWRRALKHLENYPSDKPPSMGHERMIQAFQENLEAAKPQPMFVQCHAAADDLRVLVTTGKPIVFVDEEHVVISVPTTAAGQTPAGQTRAARRGG